MSSESIEIGRLYMPIKQIADALVPQVREPFISLPGLRGYWPMSVVDFLGNAKDHSGASSDLARSGSPTFGYDGDAFVQCGVGTDFLQGSTSAQDVLGTEVWIDPSRRGLTWGCWVSVAVTPAAQGGMVSIWPTVPQYSYALYWDNQDRATCSVSGDGTTAPLIKSVSQLLDTWLFVVGRFTPSVEVAVIVNGVKTTQTSGIPASLHNSTGPFEVSRLLGLTSNVLQARYRDIFLCATVLTDVQIENLRLSSLPA